MLRTPCRQESTTPLSVCPRWCMSGTPLQNRVGEVYSMIRFLRFYPYGHYLCTKKVSLKLLRDELDSKRIDQGESGVTGKGGAVFY